MKVGTVGLDTLHYQYPLGWNSLGSAILVSQQSCKPLQIQRAFLNKQTINMFFAPINSHILTRLIAAWRLHLAPFAMGLLCAVLKLCTVRSAGRETRGRMGSPREIFWWWIW